MVALGLIPTAAGQTQDPRVREAKIACAAGEAAKGNHLLAELYAATNDPIWIFNQGRCFQQNGEPVRALARFREYLRKAKTAPTDAVAASDVAEADSYVRDLEAEIAAQNKKPAPSEPAPLVPAVPGTAPIELPVPSPPPAPPLVPTVTAPAPAADGHGHGLVVAGVGLEILGAAALIAGGVFSYLVDKTNNDANNLTSGEKVVQGTNLRAKQTDGNRYVTWQWVFYGIGGIAAASGITLHVIGTRKQGGGATAELQPAVSPSAWGLSLSVRL
jgi:hypothetical protein